MKTSMVIVVTACWLRVVRLSLLPINSVVYFSNLSRTVPVPGPIFHTGGGEGLGTRPSLKLEVGLTLLAWFTSVVNRGEVNAEFVDVARVGLAGRGEPSLTLSPRVARGTVTAVGVDLCMCACVRACV